MDDVVRIASIFGPIMCIMGLWMLSKPKDLHAMWSLIEKQPALLYMGGFLNLIIGFTILSFYKELTLDRFLLVSLLGYLMVLRALLIFFAPSVMLSMAKTLLKKSWVTLLGVIPLAWGIGLLYIRCSTMEC